MIEEVMFFVLIFLFLGMIIFWLYLLRPRTICTNCGIIQGVSYVGPDYKFPYDGRCKNCHRSIVCTEEELIKK